MENALKYAKNILMIYGAYTLSNNLHEYIKDGIQKKIDEAAKEAYERGVHDGKHYVFVDEKGRPI